MKVSGECDIQWVVMGLEYKGIVTSIHDMLTENDTAH